MAKAVLVIDMPESCENCILRDKGKCFPTSKTNILCGVYYSAKEGRRADFCPLKPMPEKGDIRKAKTMTTLTWIEGFNACIDAICRKE